MSVIKARFHKARGELSNILAKAKFLAVATDAWTSKAVESYQTYTTHFIDGQWQMVTFVLATSHFQGITGRRIAEEVHAAVKDVKCKDKVVSVVQDEAANAASAGRLLMKKYGWDPLTCGAHRLDYRHAYVMRSTRTDICRPCWQDAIG